MIPKKIHYCWFGGNPLPKKAQSCVASWRRFCPEYEIIEWNEENFDVRQNPYTAYTYDNKKFAFLSDFARLQIILREGGLYFDVDVELLRPVDELLVHPAFFGFETSEYIATGLGFGAEAGNHVVAAMLREYDGLLDGEHGTKGCPILNTSALTRLGLIPNGERQSVCSAVIYPVQFFNPYDDSTGRLNKTSDTFSIHWYAKSWMPQGLILRSALSRPFHRIFGKDCFKWLKR